MANERIAEFYRYFERNDGVSRPLYGNFSEIETEVEDNLGSIFYGTSIGLVLLGGVCVGLCRAVLLTGREKIKNADLKVIK